MSRTWKSLQVSYQHWIRSSKFNDEIKEKIKLLYYQEERFNKNPEAIYQEIISIEIGNCPICSHKLYVGNNCPNILPSGNVLPQYPTEGQLKHYKSWKNNFQKGIDARDNSYIIARNKTPAMKKSSMKVGLKTGPINIIKAHKKGSGIKFCNKCGKNTSHLIGIGCLNCHNNSDTMKNVTTKRNLENWKNPDYARNIAKNLGIVQNFIDVDAKCTKHTNCILQFYDKSIEKYTCWECYRESFALENVNNNFSNKIKNCYTLSFTQLTFRSKNSQNWSFAKQAFEQDLVDKDISWFAYIKFYIDKYGASRPLVVGKTGSKLVNSNGTDISFSMDENDGPARKFLNQNSLQWDKTKILIIPCKSEKEAYEIESNISLKHRLFGS